MCSIKCTDVDSHLPMLTRTYQNPYVILNVRYSWDLFWWADFDCRYLTAILSLVVIHVLLLLSLSLSFARWHISAVLFLVTPSKSRFTDILPLNLEMFWSISQFLSCPVYAQNTGRTNKQTTRIWLQDIILYSLVTKRLQLLRDPNFKIMSLPKF